MSDEIDFPAKAQILNQQNKNDTVLEDRASNEVHINCSTDIRDNNKITIEPSINRPKMPYNVPGAKRDNVIWIHFMEMGKLPPDQDKLDYTPETRNGFVLTVFFLIFVMLLCTFGFNVFVLLTEDVAYIFRRYFLFISLPCLLILLIMNYVFNSNCARTPPCNYICLIITMLATSCIVAGFTSRYQTITLLYALGATIALVFVCMCLACSSFDFTKFMLYVVVIATAFCVLSFIVLMGMFIFKVYIKPLHLAFLVIGTLIYSVLFVIELQTVLGGKTVELSESDYALGAFMLYSSIINIFLHMLVMIGMTEN